MYIEKSYKYNLNNIIYVSGTLPENAKILEILDILFAKEGYVLKRISNNEIVGNSIWLRNNDVQENYEEVIDENINNYKV